MESGLMGAFLSPIFGIPEFLQSIHGKAGYQSWGGSGTPRKMSESGIFGTLFLKMSVVRFLELIAKIGIAKIGIPKIGIPIGMDR
jgi:hypothetical protein